jgi:class 3 adenylate cyclase
VSSHGVSIAPPQSSQIRWWGAGKTFEFTSMAEATLKGYDEPVALYEVRPTDRGVEGTA